MGRRGKLLTPDAALEDLLFHEGWGSRRECRELVVRGRARRVAGSTEPRYLLDGVEYLARPSLLVALHKPTGYECSSRPSHHPSVLELFPARFARRGLQPIGRLDVDTSGLLLLTDEGPLNHRLSHPRYHIPKTYLLETVQEWTPAEVQALVSGVELRGDGLVRAVVAIQRGPTSVELVVDRGLYHQVRRMAAALNKTCVQLQRIAFGPWNLACLGLSPGQWTYLELTDQETGVRIPLDQKT